MAVTPIGQGKKYKWLQTPKGREYIKRQNQRHGAKKASKWRLTHREEWLVKHRETMKAIRATDKGKDYKKNYALMNAYNITLDEFKALIKSQENRCKICCELLLVRSRKTHVDHDHITGKVRGILCHYCNVALGCFKDNIQIMKNAIAYLETPKWP